MQYESCNNVGDSWAYLSGVLIRTIKYIYRTCRYLLTEAPVSSEYGKFYQS